MCPELRLKQVLAIALAAPWFLTAPGPILGQDDDPRPVKFSERERALIFQHAWQPPEPDPTNRFENDPAAAHFGRFLFFETRLSKNRDMACATCHQPAKAFADGRGLARGTVELPRHTPALWNIAGQRWLFWDGRRDSLWSQALAPMEDDRELAADRTGIAGTVFHDLALRTAYERVFGPMPPLSDRHRFPSAARPLPGEPGHPHHRAWETMSSPDRQAVNTVFANLGKAIAAYERQLVSNGSPFDLFVEGLHEDDPEKQAALSPAAKRGLKLFIGKANCRLCHSGPYFTDGEFHNNGVPPLEGGMPRDPGRYEGAEQVLQDEFNAAGLYSDDREGPAAQKLARLVQTSENWGRFKTPGLRHVALTAPYMHQGQFATLREVVHFYATLENAVFAGHHREPFLAPLDLSPSEIDDLVAFLRSLTGTPLPARLLEKPDRPFPDPTDGGDR